MSRVSKNSTTGARSPGLTPFDLLLPYQKAWVVDQSRFKIWLKSRQIGGSFATAFEVVDDAFCNQSNWIILSAGERQAIEFMGKVQLVASFFQDLFSSDSSPEIKVSEIRFPNGARILALPANASTARGYSANLVLDEFAFHENPEEIWRAVYPIISNPLRGELKLRIISTPAGMNSKFYDLWANAPDFSRHKLTVYDAVEQGLALDIDELRENLSDPDGWAQEFECQFMEHSAQVFPMALIQSIEHADASMVWPGLNAAAPGQRLTPNPLFVGIDIGRHKDLTVAWTLERAGGVCWTREVLILDKVPFPEQEAILADRLRRARFSAVDCTGIGGPVSEHLARQLGDYKLEPVNFSNDRKRELFSRAKKAFQSQSVRIPRDAKLRDDLASIQRIVTPHGIVKYLASRTRDGHADRATALALALHAAARHPESQGISAVAPVIMGGNRRRHRPMRTRFAQAWRR